MVTQYASKRVKFNIFFDQTNFANRNNDYLVGLHTLTWPKLHGEEGSARL